MSVAHYLKDPSAQLDYGLRWADWLDTDTISSSSWAVTPSGLNIITNSHDSKSTAVWVSGGTAKTKYTLTNTIVTAGGRTDQRSLTIQVIDR